MARIIDGLIFFITYFLIVYSVLIKYLSAKLSIVIILAVYAVLTLINLMLRRKKNSIEMTAEELPTYLALMDREQQTKLFYNLVPEHLKCEFKHPYFTFYENDKKILVAVLYRFMNLTQEDISAAFREAQRQNANEIIMLSRARDRKTLTLTALLPIRFLFPDKISVFKALKKHNALPKKPPKVTKKKEQIKPKEIIDAVFTKKRAKYFLFSALTLIIMSFLTPLKTYYLIMAIVPFSFSAIAYFKG